MMSETPSRRAASAFGAERGVRDISATPDTSETARIETCFARRARLLALAVPGLLLVLALASCGGAEGGGSAAGSGASGEPGSQGPRGSAGLAASSGTGGEDESSAAAASSSAAEIGVETGSEAGADLPGFEGEKVIKTAELGLRSENVREAASRAREVAARSGGGVTSSRIDGGEDEAASADLVLSVPSPEFEAALDGLRDLGSVTSDTVGGEDVTEEFVDLRSRERNLLAAEESLLRLYGEAESVDDALSIERELTNLRGQVEVSQGRIQFLEDRATTSRIALTIQPVDKPLDPAPALEPTRAVSTAWNASLGFLGAAAGVVISVIVFGWWLAPALVAAGVWWTRRSRRSGAPRSP